MHKCCRYALDLHRFRKNTSIRKYIQVFESVIIKVFKKLLKFFRVRKYKSLLHEFFFRRFLRYNTRQALIIYPLIEAMLIRIFFMIPSYFKIQFFATCFSWIMLCSKGLITQVFESMKA